jgi:glycosyltransferase involved in cell wall biosynthesis
MSSITEQAPNALMEAMACGLPVIATDVGDTREILAPCNWPMVVRPNDLHGYVEGLRAFAGRPDLRSNIGMANRRRVVAEYSLSRMVGEYTALYRAASNEARSSAV